MSSRDASDARDTIKEYGIWGSIATVAGIAALSLGASEVWSLLGGLAIAVGQYYVLTSIIARGVTLGTRVAAPAINGEALPNRTTPW